MSKLKTRQEEDKAYESTIRFADAVIVASGIVWIGTVIRLVAVIIEVIL